MGQVMNSYNQSITPYITWCDHPITPFDLSAGQGQPVQHITNQQQTIPVTVLLGVTDKKILETTSA